MRQPLNVDKVIIESLAARVQELSCLLSEEVKDKEHFKAECLRYETILDTDQSNLKELLTSLFASVQSTSNDSDDLKWWKDEIRDILECYYPTKGVESMASRIDDLTIELLVARAKCEDLEKALAVDVEFHRKEKDRFDSFRRAVRDHGTLLAEDSVAVQDWKSTLMVLDFWYNDIEVKEEEK